MDYASIEKPPAVNERTPILSEPDQERSSSSSMGTSQQSQQQPPRRNKLSWVAVAAVSLILADVLLAGWSSAVSNSGSDGSNDDSGATTTSTGGIYQTANSFDPTPGLSMTWTSSSSENSNGNSDRNNRMVPFASTSSNGGASAAETNDNETEDIMDFDDFVARFGKAYDSQSEYRLRKTIYETNVRKIKAHNDQDLGWTMGINQFADRQEHEIAKGFDKGLPHGPDSHERLATSFDLFSGLGTEAQSRNLRSSHRGLAGLPDSVDWRTHQPPVVTPIKDQGYCGSCWAFAATAVLESHVAIATGGKLLSLSPQELVSCAPNPDHCGGTGGCSGSTGELAYDYVAKHGMVTEWKYGYTAHHGNDGTCLLNETAPSGYLAGAAVGLVGYASLPTNSYDALMYAVANLGPVVVSVAASGWGLYKGGILDDFDTSEHYDMNHAVVLEGYGTDPETGQDFWLVRNSWGVLWGENGYVRLKRVDPKFIGTGQRCKTDVTPSHGVSCTGPGDNATIPDQVVCGTSGILYANVVPVGAHLLAAGG